MTMREFFNNRAIRQSETETHPTVPQTPATIQYTLPSGRVLTVRAAVAASVERSLRENAALWAELAKY